MNFDPLLIAAILIALVFLAWALLERRRAGLAEARAWDLREAMTETEVRARVLEDQARSSGEFLRNDASVQASIVADALVKRANETFAARDALAHEKLQAQLKPVSDTLAKFQEQVAAIEKERAEATGGLRQQLSELMKASVATQEEARKLSTALRRGAGVQGRWGEQMLRNVLEMAGLKHGVDYHEQVVLDGDGGRLRPDVVVKMPKNASFVIDAKCSFTAFEEGINATDDIVREAAFVRHAQSVRTHIGQLSGKQYWDALETSPDFVAMFVPGDGILSTALEPRT